MNKFCLREQEKMALEGPFAKFPFCDEFVNVLHLLEISEIAKTR